jgi:hypothetical protein
MKNISVSLSDDKFSTQARTRVNINSNQEDTLQKLVREIEWGLFRQGVQYLCIDGLLKKRVVLTITEFCDKKTPLTSNRR